MKDEVQREDYDEKSREFEKKNRKNGRSRRMDRSMELLGGGMGWGEMGGGRGGGW